MKRRRYLVTGRIFDHKCSIKATCCPKLSTFGGAGWGGPDAVGVDTGGAEVSVKRKRYSNLLVDVEAVIF